MEEFDNITRIMEEHFRKRQETIERECEKALAKVFSQYGMGIDSDGVKRLVHFVCVLKNEGIDSSEELDRFVMWYREQVKK